MMFIEVSHGGSVLRAHCGIWTTIISIIVMLIVHRCLHWLDLVICLSYHNKCCVITTVPRRCSQCQAVGCGGFEGCPGDGIGWCGLARPGYSS